MPKGTVFWYDPNLGYGFIRYDDPEDVRETRKVFVHHTGIAGDKALETGDKVTFSKVRGEQGIEAINVVRTESVGPPTGRPKKLGAGLL